MNQKNETHTIRRIEQPIAHGNKLRPVSEKPLFEIGAVHVSEIARGILSDAMIQICLDRHMHGDWGDVPLDIRDNNTSELENRGRVISAYLCSGSLFVINTLLSSPVTSIFRHEDDEMKAMIEWRPPDNTGSGAEDSNSDGSNSIRPIPEDVDISWLAEKAGFQRKVTLTRYAWKTCVAVPEDVAWLHETDCLWDLLMALRTAVANHKPYEHEFLFDIPVQQSATENVDVRVCACLSPNCITISVWETDDLLRE